MPGYAGRTATFHPAGPNPIQPGTLAPSPLPGHTGLGVIAEDEIGHAAGLFFALDLILEVIDGLDPVGYLAHFRQRYVHADARAYGQGRGKPDPVEPVIEDHADVIDGENVPEQASRHAQGKESVRHCRPEWSLPG